MTGGNPLGVAAGVALFEGLYSAAEGKLASVVVRDAVVSGALAYVGARFLPPAAAQVLTRQTTRQAVRAASDEWVRLYRAVSLEELEDIVKTGALRQHPKGFSMEGKWFTTSPEYAAKWAKEFLYGKKPYSIIEVRVRHSVLQRMFYQDRLDAIGPGYFAYPEQLPHIRFVRELPYIPWLP